MRSSCCTIVYCSAQNALTCGKATPLNFRSCTGLVRNKRPHCQSGGVLTYQPLAAPFLFEGDQFRASPTRPCGTLRGDFGWRGPILKCHKDLPSCDIYND